jgi:hypothetical protein
LKKEEFWKSERSKLTKFAGKRNRGLRKLRLLKSWLKKKKLKKNSRLIKDKD